MLSLGLWNAPPVDRDPPNVFRVHGTPCILANDEAVTTSPGGQHEVRYDPRDYRVERRFYTFEHEVRMEAHRLAQGRGSMYQPSRIEIVRPVLSKAKAEEWCEHPAHCSLTNADAYTSGVKGFWFDVAVANT